MELIALLLIILLLWVLRPFLRLLWTLRNARKQFRDMQQQAQAADSARRAYARECQNQGGDSPAAHRKVFDKSVGEYIDYEEIECSAYTSSESFSTQSTVIEEQITDAEWEEI